MVTKIVFTDLTGKMPVEFFPKPARKSMPNWFLEIPAHTEGLSKENGRADTAKKCMPMFDAMSSGYILFTPFDLLVSRTDDGKIYYEWPDEEGLIFHDPKQIEGYPKISSEYAGIPKMLDPWGIKTPKGYSCLFIPPMNHETEIQIFSGVIDTDNFNFNGHMPFTLRDPNFVGLIPAGSPFAQVIPFKRESFRMTLGDDSERKKIISQKYLLSSMFRGVYRKFWWQKKEYL